MKKIHSNNAPSGGSLPRQNRFFQGDVEMAEEQEVALQVSSEEDPRPQPRIFQTKEGDIVIPVELLDSAPALALAGDDPLALDDTQPEQTNQLQQMAYNSRLFNKKEARLSVPVLLTMAGIGGAAGGDGTALDAKTLVSAGNLVVGIIKLAANGYFKHIGDESIYSTLGQVIGGSQVGTSTIVLALSIVSSLTVNATNMTSEYAHALKLSSDILFIMLGMLDSFDVAFYEVNTQNNQPTV